MSSHDLAALLEPRAIAVIGASAELTKLNGRPLKHLLDKGYPGRLYPVNPKYTTVAGLRCWPSVADLPERVDLAIVVLPARDVVEAVRELGRAGVPFAVVFSSGFGETGDEGRQRERDLLAAAAAGGVRICGPNCLGFVNAFERVTATFSQYAEGPTPAGPVGFVTQSGAFGTAIAALARQRGIGLGYFVNTGNEADVSFPEVMRHVIEDPRIRVGAGYVEGLRDGAGLVALAGRAMALGKPLVLTKVGRLGAGSRAAASHTGSLAGEDRVFDAVLRQHGVIRARNEEQMLDAVDVLASCALPAGSGLGIVTMSGGAGVLMADRAEELGLQVPVLAPRTRDALLAVIPDFASPQNPVDITAQFLARPALLTESVRIVLEDPQVHVGVVWLQLMHAAADRIVGLFAQIRDTVSKPFVVVWVAAPESGLRQLRELGIAVLRGAEPAVDAVAGLVAYAGARRRRDAERASSVAAPAAGPTPQPLRLRLPEARGAVDTATAVALLRDAGVPMLPVCRAADAQAAADAAQALGWPVVLKIESPDILHKTEVGGVRLDLRSAEAVRAAFGELVAAAREHRPGARLDGVIVQPMAPGGGVEMVVGLQDDPVFGPVVMVGLGGVFVEVLQDVAFRRCPVAPEEAHRMLDELRGVALLGPVRGRAAVDRAALAELIVAVSLFGLAATPRLAELDLNPVRVDAQGAVALDVVMVLR